MPVPLHASHTVNYLAMAIPACLACSTVGCLCNRQFSWTMIGPATQLHAHQPQNLFGMHHQETAKSNAILSLTCSASSVTVPTYASGLDRPTTTC